MSDKDKDNSGGKGMKKTLGVTSVFAICTGAAFSSGFFLLPGFAADETGPSLPVAFLIAGLFMLPAIFSISELGSAMPRSGGPYFFITRSFGPLTGIIGALGIYFQWLMKGAFAFVGVGYYLSIFFEVPIQLLAIGLIALFTLINLAGVKQTSAAEITLVGILIVILGWFVVSGVAEILPRTDEVTERFQPLIPHGITGFIGAIALVFVSFGGMGQVASVAGEIKNPSSTIPRGMLYSLAVVTFFYLAGTGIIVALVEQDILHDNPTPVAEAAEQFQRISIPMVIIVIAALAAFTSTGNAVILSAARYPLALSRDRLFWKRFSNLSKKGIPVNAVILTGIILVSLVLTFDVEEIAKLASGFLLFTFIGMCLSVIVFRESRSGDYKPKYKSPLYPWTQVTGIIIYLALIIFIGAEAWIFLAGILILGILWYYFGVRESTTFSAAIYRLFGRIAQTGCSEISAGGMNLSFLQGEHLSSVAERAIVISLDETTSLDEAVSRASDAIRERTGGEKDQIKKQLSGEVKHMLHPVEFNISVAPTLLEGIEQPEMVIIKGDIAINDNHVDGLLILIDDKDSSERLLKLASQLDTSIHREGFAEAWKKAETAKDMKSALLQEIRTLTLHLDKFGPGSSLIGKSVGQVKLPKGSLITLLQRKGKLSVPRPDVRLEEGDEITIVSEKEAFDQLSSKFRNSGTDS